MKKIIILTLAVLAMAMSAAAAQEKKVNLGAGGFYVEAVEMKRTSALRGRFQMSDVKAAADGGGVQIYLMNAENLEKFRAKKRADFYFKSGLGTAGDFFVRLRKGTYFLVVSNPAAAGADKSVMLTLF